MKYTIITTTTNRFNPTVIKTVETDNLNDTIEIKKRTNVYTVGTVTKIIDTETNTEVVTKKNYYGENRVYRKNYIKLT